MNNSELENYTASSGEYEMSVAEALSLEIERDSRRYSTDLERAVS